MRELKVAVVQMQPQLGKMQANISQMVELIRKIATTQPVDIIVFPELSVTGYEGGQRFTQMAQRVPGAVTNIIGQAAHDFAVHVVIGMAIRRDVEAVLYNGAVLIAPDGEVESEYRKVHLQADERLTFRPGRTIKPVETAVGTIGIMLGWDLAFPEVARNLVLQGAEALLIPAAWETKNIAIWRTLLIARAYENDVFIAAANRFGEEPSYIFGGQSAILAPGGEVLAAIEDDTHETAEGEVITAPGAGYAIVRLDLDAVRRRREETQIILARQPGAYRQIVSKY
ncbi:MAG: carbon-nitrogen hydrolase family protein [Anaerolineae bacterium]|nr:carbon-nitrogen hydrolase family protein [Anaerolineae bacterium]